MKKLPAPVPPGDRTDLIVYTLILAVVASLAMTGRLTSSNVTMTTAAVVALLAAWTGLRRPPSS
jgi:hypothetical protein